MAAGRVRPSVEKRLAKLHKPSGRRFKPTSWRWRMELTTSSSMRFSRRILAETRQAPSNSRTSSQSFVDRWCNNNRPLQSMPAVPIEESITNEHPVCPECGHNFKSLRRASWVSPSTNPQTVSQQMGGYLRSIRWYRQALPPFARGKRVKTC